MHSQALASWNIFRIFLEYCANYIKQCYCCISAIVPDVPGRIVKPLLPVTFLGTGLVCLFNTNATQSSFLVTVNLQTKDTHRIFIHSKISKQCYCCISVVGREGDLRNFPDAVSSSPVIHWKYWNGWQPQQKLFHNFSKSFPDNQHNIHISSGCGLKKV